MTITPSTSGLFQRLRARLPLRASALAETRAVDVTTRQLPRWVRGVDAVTIALALLALRVLVAGGGRIRIGDLRVSLTSVWRPLLLAVALLAIRHAAFRVAPLHRRTVAGLQRLWRAQSAREAVAPFLVSRTAVLLVGFLAVATFGFEQRPQWQVSENDLLNLPARWDTGWYLNVLHEGYSWNLDPQRPGNIAFFPALPLATRLVAVLTGASDPLAMFLVVVVGFYWALTYLYRLARLDLPADAAHAALLFAVFYPFAAYYSALYTEALFLLVAVGAFYHFRCGELVRAGLFGLIAGLTRPNGCMLALPLGLIALVELARSRGWVRGGAAVVAPVRLSQVARQVLAAGMPVAGLLGYSAYIYHVTGDPFAWIKVQQAWGRGVDDFSQLFGARQALVASEGIYAYLRGYPVEIMNGAAALFALASIWPVSRRFGLPYGLFIAACVLPPLYSANSDSWGRYTSPLFPMFLWLGASVAPSRRTYWIAAFAAGEALVAALFFTWRPPF